MPWLILYYIDIVNKIISITIVDTSGDIVLKSSNDYVTLESWYKNITNNHYFFL